MTRHETTSLEASVSAQVEAGSSSVLPSEQSDAEMTTEPAVRIRQPRGPRQPDTKQAHLVALLRRKRGASVAELMEATGWQAHSVRGAISGTVKRKLGLTVITEEMSRRGRVYRILAEG